MISDLLAQVYLHPPRPKPLSDRLRAWADVVAAIGQRLEHPTTVLRLLTEGVRRVMDAQYAILLVNAEPGILEVRSVSGPDPEAMKSIEKDLDRPLIGWQVELAGGPLSRAYLERRDILITDSNSLPVYAVFRRVLKVNSQWTLPLSITPYEDCVGMIVIGRASRELPTEDDRAFAAAFIAQVAVAVKNAQLYEAERWRRRKEQHLRALAEAQQQVAAAVGTALELPEVAARVLAAIAKMIPCDTASLFMRYGDVMRVCAVHNLPPDLIGAEYALAWPLAEQMISTRMPVWLADAQSDSRVIALPDGDRVHGWLAAPFVIGERMIGQVSLGSSTAGVYSHEEAELLESLAWQASLALENAQIYSEATRRLQQMATLNEISSAAILTLDFEGVVQRLILALRRTLKHENLTLWMATDLGGRPALRAVGADRATIAWGEGLVGRSAAQQEALWEYITQPGPGAAQQGSQLCAPIRIGDRVLGVIDVRSEQLLTFSDSDLHFLSIVAGQLAGALENARLYAAERRRTEEALVMLDVTEAISSAHDLAEMLTVAARRTAQVCRVDLCLMLLLDEAQTHFQLAGRALAAEAEAALDWAAFSAALKQFDVSDQPRLMEMLALGQPRVVAADELTGPLWQFFSAHAALNLLMLTPLRASNRSLGMLLLGDYHRQPEFDSRQMSLAAAIGRQLAVAVDALRLRQVEFERLEQLKQTQMQLIQSAKLAAVGQLAAGVAHEINNPLTTISGFSELLLNDLPPESSLHADLSMIRREAQRARDVVRRLLDFARQSGPHREPADLNDLVSETVTLMRNAAATKNVRVVEQYSPGLPWARMDVNQIKQVVLNLLNNAMQAMPKGGALTVATEASRGELPGVILHVADTGVGIAPENLERIFEPFFTTKPPGEGTGLGLALSYSIVQEHGGRIEVSSTVNEGTTFKVWLPLEIVDC